MTKIVSRPVKTSFWTDEKIVDAFSPEDKLFYLYLITNPHTTQLGIYQFVPKIAAFELGYSVDSVRVLLERFEKKYDVIKYSEATNEIAVKNFLRHSIVKGGKPVLDCLKAELNYIKDINLIIYIYNYLIQYKDLNNTVKDFIIYIKEKYINDNENENERYVDVSWTNRPSLLSEPQKTTGFVAPSVEEVDAYCLAQNYEYVNPEAFVKFYASKNWFVGKNKMTSWHDAVAGWNARDRDSGKKKYLRGDDGKAKNGLQKWGI